MSELDRNIQAFDAQRSLLEAGHTGRWVVFHDRRFVDAFDSFHDAANEATRRFDPGTFLIREVRAADPVMPPALQFRLVHAP